MRWWPRLRGDPLLARLAETISSAGRACPRVCCRCCWVMPRPAPPSFAGVDKVSFTGSVATGRKIAEACASQLIPCTLELGGNDAMIVCADADLDRAADGAWLGSCMNTGHYCCGTERIYVVEAVYDEFLRLVMDKGKGPAPGPAVRLGRGCRRVFWDRQLAIIEAHVEDARAKGANILMGATQPEPARPLLRTHRYHRCRQQYGHHAARRPSAPCCIQKVANEEEAVALANDSEFGLNGNVWTRDKDRVTSWRQPSTPAPAASMTWPSVTAYRPHPSAGAKLRVGPGERQKACAGYCHEMPIVIDRFGGKMQNAYPYSAKSAESMKKLMDFIWGENTARALAELAPGVFPAPGCRGGSSSSSRR